ncbi:MAG: dihydrofolate synthase/folylpolyglutamate synthase [Patiriisocius sp.]|jgi:dihydrofolate synthase/folylpolyglutamate synthase
MYQHVGKAAYKIDLSNSQLLSTYLGNPHHTFKSIHVAGTNGKGSTSHMLASVLQEAGYKVGLYTSPHLKDFRERIKINGEMIPKRAVSSFVSKHQAFFEKNQLSFFEMTVGLAFHEFAKQQVDIAIVEVGLGGRLDSTNIITPELSVITNIGLDHTQFLGTTLIEIAREKAGIIKPNVPVVIGETLVETKPVFQEIAEDKNASIIFSEEVDFKESDSDLKGLYQKLNQRTVMVSVNELKSQGWRISEDNIQKGLQNVVKNTGLLGRWQQLKNRPLVIADTAHNREGLAFTMAQLSEINCDKLHLVIGVVSDKDLDRILPIFPKNAIYYFCQPEILRAMDVFLLQQKAAEYELEGAAFSSVKIAYQAALDTASINDVIYIGGSTFVVAEVV